MMENSWLTETLCGLMTIFAGYLKWAMMENVVELFISGSNTRVVLLLLSSSSSAASASSSSL